MRWLVCLLLVGCAAESIETSEVEGIADDGKADASSELRVRAGDTTLWMNQQLVRRGDDIVMRGRTSRNIDDGRAFIFDDIYGDFAIKSARTFEVTWPVSTARGLVDGVNLYTQLNFGARGMTARVVVRPRFVGASGALTLTAEITPVIVAGRIVYRAKGRSTKQLSAVAASAGVARLVDATHFEVDLSFEQVTATEALQITGTAASGAVTASASLGMFIRYFGATTGDVEEVFPSPTCTAEREACLAALPDGALDLGSCGAALLVQACRGEIGVIVDQAAIASTLAAADARLAGPFATDATALVGTARAPALRTALRAVIEARANAARNLWLLSATARDAVLSTELDFDRAYANPLVFVPPSPRVPGDVAATRQVVADTLLDYLQTTDYVHSPFERSYPELTRVFRAQHVASLRAFRETVLPETVEGIDMYIDAWLGAHTEIAVDANGVAFSVLVELD